MSLYSVGVFCDSHREREREREREENLMSLVFKSQRHLHLVIYKPIHIVWITIARVRQEILHCSYKNYAIVSM